MSDNIRPIDDHYRSPPETFRALASVESFRQHGSKVYYPVTGQTDFLRLKELWKPNLVSNPPYGRLHGQRVGKARAATTIIRHGIDLLAQAGPSGGKLCCLLDLRYLLSEDRNLDQGLFTEFPPARVHAFLDRITMYPAAFEGSTTRGKQSFAWFVWEWPFIRPGHIPPVTSRLHGKAFRQPSDVTRFDLSEIVSSKQEIAEAAE